MKHQKLHCETVHSEVHSEVHYYSSIDTYIIDGIEFRPAKNIAPDIYVSQGGTFIRRGKTEISYGTKTYRKATSEPSHIQVCVGVYETKSGKIAGKSVNLGRLVLDAWNPTENEESFDVDHVDNNPFNNQLKNLRWLSHRENVKRARHPNPKWLQTTERQEKRSKLYQKLKSIGLSMPFSEYQQLNKHERKKLLRNLT